MIAVLDDDPTGSQTVYGATVVTALDEVAGDPLTFYLTNTRSLDEAEAAQLTYAVARRLFESDPDVEIVSRSDSTLRGHVLAEVQAIDRARRDVLGAGYDGVLLAPAFFEAGRFTRGDVHYAGETPVGETEFAQDATFGYSSSNLVDFVAEKGGGEALSLSPGDELPPVRDGQWVVVNAESYDDLDAVVRAARASGRVLLYRTGPSFVRALAGLDERPPLSEVPRREGHGLVVVGSHVGLTSRQVAAAQERCGLIEIELDVNELDVAGVSERVVDALARGDVLLYTSRKLEGGGLEFSRRVSKAVTEVVQRGAEDQARLGDRQGRDHVARRGRARARHPPRRGAGPAPARDDLRAAPDRGRPRRDRHAVRRVRRQRRRRRHARRRRGTGALSMLATGTDLLARDGTAVAAITTYTLESTRAIVLAAERTGPARCCCPPDRARSVRSGVSRSRAAALAAARAASVPVGVHLRPLHEAGEIEACIALGYSSVMFDGSHQDYEDNVTLTRLVVEQAHAAGVWVEAELGALSGDEDASGDVSRSAT